MPITTIWLYFKLLHPYTSILVSIITMIVALPLTEEFNFFSLISMGLAMLSIQFSIGLSNDIMDRNFDKIAKPWKPFISSDISLNRAILLLILLLAFSFLMVYPFDIISIFFFYFGFFLGLAYNVKLKRTILSWLPYSLAIPTVMVFARAVHGQSDFLFLFFLYPLGLLAGPALNIANQLPGAEKAYLSGERSLIHVLKRENAGKISVILLLLLTIFTFIFLVYLNLITYFSIFFVLASLVLILFYSLSLKKGKIEILWLISILIVAFLGMSFLPNFFNQRSQVLFLLIP